MPFSSKRQMRENSRPSSLPMAFDHMNLSDDPSFGGEISKFSEFPPPPLPPSRKAISLSGTTSQSDSEDEDQPPIWVRPSDDNAQALPPIGVFWDIENCQVPKGKSAVAVAQAIRNHFFENYREAEFVVVCDVKKENNQILQELNDAQVNLIHVASTYKNACDEKLRQSIRRFADTHGSPSAIILISGDINFAADLSDLRHRKKIHVILLHKTNCSQALIMCASEHHDFLELVEDLPPRSSLKLSLPVDLLVSCLPEDKDPLKVKNRLRQLSDNCGGRVVSINKSLALVRFASEEIADRAQKRMHGEDVYGHQINVGYANRTPRSISKGLIPNFTHLHYQAQHSALSPHHFKYHPFHSPFLNSKELSAPPPLMLPPPPSIFLPSNSQISRSSPLRKILGEAKKQMAVKPRVIRGRNELSGPPSQDIEHQDNFLKTDEEYMPPLSELLSSSKRLTKEMPSFNKRMEIPQASNEEMISERSNEMIRMKIVSLLQEVPNHSLPYGVFLKCYQRRYHTNIELIDLNRFTDAVLISNDDRIGKIVVLNPSYRHTPSEDEKRLPDRNIDTTTNTCIRHLHKIDAGPLPNIIQEIKSFSEDIYKLLKSHNGILSLKSFTHCFAIELKKSLIECDNGIPLEYLILSVPKVTIKTLNLGQKCKYILWSTDNDKYNCDTPHVTAKLNAFCEKIFDLLHNLPRGQLEFNNFSNYYHRTFGHQFRISDYGFNKLSDLLEAIPAIVKVIGEGNKRMVILSKEAQTKRFVNHIHYILDRFDLTSLSELNLPELYLHEFKRPWDVVEYGASNIDELFENITDKSLIFKKEFNGEIIILPPKNFQPIHTNEKINELSSQVFEILSQTTNFSISYEEFTSCIYQFEFRSRIPEFGFTKQKDLFKYIEHLVEIIEEKYKKKIRLKYDYRLYAFAEQLVILIQENLFGQINLKRLSETYLTKFGFLLPFESLNVKSPEDALRLVSNQISLSADGSYISLISLPLESFKKNFLLTLWDFLPQKRCLSLHEFSFTFWTKWKRICTLDDLERNFLHLVDISKEKRTIQMKNLLIFSWEVNQMLLMNLGIIPMISFSDIYLKRFGKGFNINIYGFSNLRTLVSAIPEAVQINGKGKFSFIKWNSNFEEISPSDSTPSVLEKNQKFINHEDDSATDTNEAASLIDSASNNHYQPQPPDPSQLPLPTKLQIRTTSRMAANLFSGMGT